MSRNLTTLQPSTTYPYLIQTDVETTTGGILTASLQTGLGVPVAHLDVSVATASYALNTSVDTGSFISTASYNVDSSSWNSQIASLYALTSSYLTTQSFNLVTSSFVKSVNSILPDSVGNVAVSIAATGTGTLANRPPSASNAFLYVVSQDPNPADNGDAYIFVTSSLVPGSGSWEVIAPLDQAASDARYLMLAGTNSPMQGAVDWGGYTISNLAIPTQPSESANKLYVDQLLALENLQTVTTRGNTTTNSVIIQNNLSNGSSVSTVGSFSHAEGFLTTAVGTYSHAEGRQTISVGQYSHAEGGFTTSVGINSHAEGQSTKAVGTYSHAEGQNTTTIGTFSHAEGKETAAEGTGTHAEGNLTTAIGNYSHAEGTATTAVGVYSHAEGWGTVTNGLYQHAQGLWNNYTDTTNGAFIVGNGTSNVSRSNLIFAAGNQVQITGSLLVSGGTISGSFAGSITNAATASYVSGAILNYPDPFTTTAPVFRIVTLTSAEYTALAVKDANTFYAIV